MKAVIKTFQGLESVLASELKEHGVKDTEILNRAVSCQIDKQLLYRLNMRLHCAVRILVPLAEFSLFNADNLYYKSLDIPWEDWFRSSKTFAIFASGTHPEIKNSTFASLRVKDGIADRFRRLEGKRPSVDPKRPNIRIEVHINNRSARILMDASGDSLHLRNYKSSHGRAPISEVLAAGLVKLSGWQGKSTLLDPMCGSGTIPIEAALMSSKSMPQFHRNNFSCRHWKNYNKPMWQSERNKAMRDRHRSSASIIASDKHRKVVDAAEDNADKAGVSRDIKFFRNDFFNLTKPAKMGFLIINPPYDHRVKQEEVEAFYKEMSDKLKNDFTGWTAGIISANFDALKAFSLRAHSKTRVYNGNLPANFEVYKLYKGSKD